MENTDRPGYAVEEVYVFPSICAKPKAPDLFHDHLANKACLATGDYWASVQVGRVFAGRSFSTTLMGFFVFPKKRDNACVMHVNCLLKDDLMA